MAEFKVTTQVLKAKMDETLSKIAAVQQKVAQYENQVQRSSSCWVGEAGDLYRKNFAQFKPELDEIIEVWKKHTVDLGTIAGLYEEAERQNVAQPGGLPSDVIS